MNKKICLKCGSSDVAYKPKPFELMGGNLMQYHKCTRCGYEGIMPDVVKTKDIRANKKGEDKI